MSVPHDEEEEGRSLSLSLFPAFFEILMILGIVVVVVVVSPLFPAFLPRYICEREREGDEAEIGN